MTCNASQMTVAILCGGRGTRLRPTTDTVPKALVEVRGRPILDQVLGLFMGKGLRRFVLCVGYRGDMLRAHYAAPPAGADIAFSDAGEQASMLQRIWAVRDLLADHMVLSYCDTYIDVDIARMAQAHVDSGVAATIVVSRIRSPFGLVNFDRDHRVRSFDEKPVFHYYVGCAMLGPRLRDHVTEELLSLPDGAGLVRLYQDLAAKGLLGAFEHAGTQITFNTESERRIAEKEMGAFYTLEESSAG